MITDARPTSEPVPEVVGTATTGAIPPASARVHQSSRSSKSHRGRVCPDISATAFAASSALPPPNPITPSWPPSRNARTPSATFDFHRVRAHLVEDCTGQSVIAA